MKTKNIGIRTDEYRIDSFKQACEDLPLSFNARKMIESYMDYVIDTSNKYKETGKIKFGFVEYDGNIVMCNMDGQQKYFVFEENKE